MSIVENIKAKYKQAKMERSQRKWAAAAEKRAAQRVQAPSQPRRPSYDTFSTGENWF